MKTVGIPKESSPQEPRVAATPEIVKKLIRKGCRVYIENGAGEAAGFPDDDFLLPELMESVEIVSRDEVFHADILLKINKPVAEEISKMRQGALLISFLEPYAKDGTLENLARQGVNAMAMELIPRSSRAQSMDALSSQANLGGYKGVLEAARLYGRFFPMMMTSAGSAKPAKVAVLGAGVAGLQAIGTARRLGANVFAYDIRPEVKEQILSLGGKVIEINVSNERVGRGGYAAQLSANAAAEQQRVLTETLKKFDVIISTANVPGRKAPTLITEEAVKGMRAGSVIVDMAAASGGNCTLTEPGKTVMKYGVHIVGITNFPALMPADASSFYSRNVYNLLELILEQKDGNATLNFNLEDDIIASSLTVFNGLIRFQGGK